MGCRPLRGLIDYFDSRPGAYAPGFTLSPAPQAIAVGKQADLMIVKGNPVTKITDIENVQIVFKDGSPAPQAATHCSFNINPCRLIELTHDVSNPTVLPFSTKLVIRLSMQSSPFRPPKPWPP